MFDDFWKYLRKWFLGFIPFLISCLFIIHKFDLTLKDFVYGMLAFLFALVFILCVIVVFFDTE